MNPEISLMKLSTGFSIKGPRTEEAVEENDLLLFPDMFEGIDGQVPTPAMQRNKLLLSV